jgi:hypothetical protein
MGRRTLTQFAITYRTNLPEGTHALIAPGGLVTPHGSCTGFTVEGGEAVKCIEATTGQSAFKVSPTSGSIALTWRFDSKACGPYPQAMFAQRDNRFTRFADALASEAATAAGDLHGLSRAKAVARAAAERFSYGHPETVFNEGLDEVPALGCGLVEGSCVDINTYFIAALRAAGIEAGYATGFFFPSEKSDHCTDGHCWVITRIDGETQEWDIAHHLKLGTRDIQPGLNPKPGFRAGVFHSMGLDFPDLGITELKALIEPLPLGTANPWLAEPEIRLHHPGLFTAAE